MLFMLFMILPLPSGMLTLLVSDIQKEYCKKYDRQEDAEEGRGGGKIIGHHPEDYKHKKNIEKSYDPALPGGRSPTPAVELALKPYVRSMFPGARNVHMHYRGQKRDHKHRGTQKKAVKQRPEKNSDDERYYQRSFFEIRLHLHIIPHFSQSKGKKSLIILWRTFQIRRR